MERGVDTTATRRPMLIDIPFAPISTLSRGVVNVHLICRNTLKTPRAWCRFIQMSLCRRRNAMRGRLLLLGTPRRREVLWAQIHGLAQPLSAPRLIGRHQRRTRNHKTARPRAAEDVIAVHRADGEGCAAARTPSHSLTTTEAARSAALSHLRPLRLEWRTFESNLRCAVMSKDCACVCAVLLEIVCMPRACMCGRNILVMPRVWTHCGQHTHVCFSC